MKQHVWNRKFKTLELWDSHNTQVFVNCATFAQAKLIVKARGFAAYTLCSR